MSFFGDLFGGISKVASPFLSMIPGGGFLSAGLGALGNAASGFSDSSLLSGGLNFLGARAQQSSASMMADRSNDLQLNLADTAMQRRVADMEKAGLNPILAGMNQQGAGSFTPTVPPVQNAIGQGVSSAVQANGVSEALQGLRLDNASKNISNQILHNEAEKSFSTAQLAKLSLNAAKNASDVAGGDFGKAMAYINAVSSAVHGAGQAVSSAAGASSALPIWSGPNR